MVQQVFCEYCMSENGYKLYKKEKISMINDEEITFISKEAVCNTCGNEIFISEVCDNNLNSLYEEYKNKHNIIHIDEIKYIITKYSIKKEVLSLLLGWKSDTLQRYLDGDMPLDSHSDILKKIYENNDYYSIVLQTNKERINAIDYNKSRQAVNNILSISATEEKLEATIQYILIRCEDLTTANLQKLLYYVQGFYYAFTSSFIFNEDCEASIDGPVFKSVLETYEKFGCKEINKRILNNNKLKLEDDERNIIESIIKFFGCYSGKILKQMTLNEAPWVLSRIKIIDKCEEDDFYIRIEKNLIAEYFENIKEKYNMINLLDIQKYSINLFNKISM